jgi:hypothetical protein
MKIYPHNIIAAEKDMDFTSGDIKMREADRQIIEENADSFTDHICRQLRDEGIVVEVDFDYFGSALHNASTDEEHEAWRRADGFWEWYN